MYLMLSFVYISHVAFIGALVSAIVLVILLALTVTGFTIALLIVFKRTIGKRRSKTSLSKTQLAMKYKPTLRYSAAKELKPDTVENVDYEPEPISHMAAAIDTDDGEDNIEVDYEPVAVPLDTNQNISYALHAR